MKKCDVYVQTSKNEGLGLTVIEAKILEKLIICTNFSTASSLIENNIDGILCSFSPDNIAENIIRLIEDEDLRNKLLRNIKTKSKFNTTSEVEKIFELLE